MWRSNTTLTPSDSETTRKLHTGSQVALAEAIDLEASMIVVSLQQIDQDNDALDSRWQIEEALARPLATGRDSRDDVGTNNGCTKGILRRPGTSQSQTS